MIDFFVVIGEFIEQRFVVAQEGRGIDAAVVPDENGEAFVFENALEFRA